MKKLSFAKFIGISFLSLLLILSCTPPVSATVVAPSNRPSESEVMSVFGDILTKVQSEEGSIIPLWNAHTGGWPFIFIGSSGTVSASLSGPDGSYPFTWTETITGLASGSYLVSGEAVRVFSALYTANYTYTLSLSGGAISTFSWTATVVPNSGNTAPVATILLTVNGFAFNIYTGHYI